MDYNSLNNLMQNLNIRLSSWEGSDPCANSWEGIICTNSRVTSLKLTAMGLKGHLPDSIQLLSAEEVSLNTEMTGPIPTSIGSLTELVNLNLAGCSFNGQIPQTIGSLKHLYYLDLNNNKLSGKIPPSINQLGGSLSDLNYLDLTSNQLGGSLPFSSETTPGLGMLHNAQHFHFGENQFSGSIPTQLFSSEMALLHLLLDRNNLSGEIPSTLGLMQNLQILFSNFGNSTYFKSLEMSLNESFWYHNIHVDSVSLESPSFDSFDYFQLVLKIFPSDKDRFKVSEASALASVLRNQTLSRPMYFGPFFVLPSYDPDDDDGTEVSKGSKKALIIGEAIGGCVLLLLLALLLWIYFLRKKSQENMRQNRSVPLEAWITGSSLPQLKGARLFSFKEVKECSQGFSKANDIGSGCYGKVYQGVLPTGEMVAIKRAKRESTQGMIEFKAEVELLSRAHHNNLVSLLRFCLEQDEQMLIYQYVPNGNLLDCLSGKSGIRLNWMRRLKIALGTTRGLAYLHEHATPPIIHRDIKPNNILLDKDLNAKVADFGLSKSLAGSDRDHVTTQVKGTMGYLDPEYFMTHELTEKSDVYSFGVVMLELLTARRPIEHGKYIVREIQMRIDTTKLLYNLQDILDPAIGLVTELTGIEMFVDMAMLCVKDTREERPRMGQVVKEIEKIIHVASFDVTNSASTSAGYEGGTKDGSEDPYSSRSLEYSGIFDYKDS